MCLIIKKDEYIKTAEKDILCFKNVFMIRLNKWSGFFHHNNRIYDFNKLVAAERRLSDFPNIEYCKIEHLELYNEDAIFEGFHAFINKKRCIDTIEAKYCIIPKGTEICYGNNNDIVAVNMIVFRTKLDYIKYKLNSIFKLK